MRIATFVVRERGQADVLAFAIAVDRVATEIERDVVRADDEAVGVTVREVVAHDGAGRDDLTAMDRGRRGAGRCRVRQRSGGREHHGAEHMPSSHKTVSLRRTITETSDPCCKTRSRRCSKTR